ncbi:MAG TPA: heavy-metal-associated domain-containing protein [Anaerolineales bacterium]|nr:heavy-metal-associated domain-containing protein [Anaerolineales bacterium]
MTTLTLTIPAISCNHCKKNIERELSELEGISAVVVDVPTKQARFEFSEPATEQAISDLLTEIGYAPGDSKHNLISL